MDSQRGFPRSPGQAGVDQAGVSRMRSGRVGFARTTFARASFSRARQVRLAYSLLASACIAALGLGALPAQAMSHQAQAQAQPQAPSQAQAMSTATIALVDITVGTPVAGQPLDYSFTAAQPQQYSVTSGSSASGPLTSSQSSSSPATAGLPIWRVLAPDGSHWIPLDAHSGARGNIVYPSWFYSPCVAVSPQAGYSLDPAVLVRINGITAHWDAAHGCYGVTMASVNPPGMQTISAVSITVTQPFTAAPITASASVGTNYAVRNVQWFRQPVTPMASGETYAYGKNYLARLHLCPHAHYALYPAITGSINGGHFTIEGFTGSQAITGPVELSADGCIFVHRTFTPMPSTINISGASGNITGSVEVGGTLTASAIGFVPSTVNYAWQWRRNGVSIPGAHSASYKVTSADVGSTLSAALVLTLEGYQTRTVALSATKHIPLPHTGSTPAATPPTNRPAQAPPASPPQAPAPQPTPTPASTPQSTPGSSTSSSPRSTPGSAPDSGAGASAQTAHLGNTYYIRHTLTSGTADVVLAYGRPGDTVLVGDWDGDGQDTLMVRRGNEYHIRNSLTSGPAEEVIYFGRADDVVLVGDWNADGRDTLAVRRGNVYYISNSLASGPAETVIAYGRVDDVVYVGDWNGDGRDTLAVRRGNVYYFSNSLTSGSAETVMAYGRVDDVVYVGDWDGDGRDTLAVRRGNIYHIRNSLSSGTADVVFAYGRVDDVIYVGNWNGRGGDSLTVRR